MAASMRNFARGQAPTPGRRLRVWDGRKVHLSTSLGFDHAERKTFEEQINAGAGIAVSNPWDPYHVLITQYADGDEYLAVRPARKGKLSEP